MDYNYSYNTDIQSSSKIYGVGIIFFLIGILLIGFILYLIYQYVLKQNKQTTPQIIQPIKTIIENIKTIIKPPQYDLNIDDLIDEECIQKRKIYDSDFDRTTYPINDNEIIYF